MSFSDFSIVNKKKQNRRRTYKTNDEVLSTTKKMCHSANNVSKRSDAMVLLTENCSTTRY